MEAQPQWRIAIKENLLTLTNWVNQRATTVAQVLQLCQPQSSPTVWQASFHMRIARPPTWTLVNVVITPHQISHIRTRESNNSSKLTLKPQVAIRVQVNLMQGPLILLLSLVLCTEMGTNRQQIVARNMHRLATIPTKVTVLHPS